ncbi:uncharacterized protein [Macrobrachium rosenbergii]|uniref:uncharacterized protein n=1 Tax=Macrobrachium rosenbergii TaxID=79674 RepID=UPI0034D3C71D
MADDAGPECGNFFLPHNDEGVIYSSDGKTSLNCDSYILSPEGTTMTIKCPHFDLASKGCRREKVLFIDPLGGSKVKGCKRRGPTTLTTSSNQLWIRHTRKKLKGNECTGGYMCSVSVGKVPTVFGQCSTYNIGQAEGTIIYSNNDGKRRNCRYKMKGPPGTKTSISCSVFGLQQSGCKREKIIIKDNISGDQQSYCSGDLAPDFTIATNSLIIQHIRKDLKKKCSNGFLCFVGATDGSGTGGACQALRPFCGHFAALRDKPPLYDHSMHYLREFLSQCHKRH